jgi:hypothetical protein
MQDAARYGCRIPVAEQPISEDSVLKLESNATRFLDLQTPEALEFKTAPMWMCCVTGATGSALNAVTLFTFTVTWNEDPDAACSGILF